jgi:hypothetical protein
MTWYPGTLISCVAVTAAVWCLVSQVRAGQFEPNIYVPYEDLAELIDPTDKAVLMDRGEFEDLLAAAEANALEADSIELGQVEQAEYSAEVVGEELTLTGKLQVVSLGKGPVAVLLGFAQTGLTRVVLDGRPAPLGYNKQGKLTLIITTKGSYQLEVGGTAQLKELSGGGMQFGISLPAAVAGNMKLSAPGDLEIHATVPVSRSSYDKEADRTNAELTLGGQSKLTVVLLGNGRQEEDRAILLGESATTVRLTRSHQVLGCLYTLQVLRRGVGELQFQLPAEWTITKVTCPSLLRWSVDTAEESQGLKTLTVRLRSDKVGTTALHIEASAVRGDQRWYAPRVILVGAAYQRGHLMVNTDEELSVRGQELTDARREDVSAAASLPGMVGGPAGRLYFHWGDNWSVSLELTTVELRRSIKERQRVFVSPEKVTLRGDFDVTAIERELFDMSFVLPDLARQWQVKTVQVDKQKAGFEYRIEEEIGQRLLKIELPRPIRPEKVANVTIELQHVPSAWHWPSDAAEREILVPLIESQGETVSGHVLISALDDLDALPQKVPEELEVVPVGRMASLGMQRAVQYAYSYNVSAEGQIQLQVSRRRPRTSGDAVGLVTVGPREFAGDWRITYTISRASAGRLYLLADKSLGQEIKITSATVPISSKSIVTPDETTLPLPDELAQRYDLWSLNLDHKVVGGVIIDIHYERPTVPDSFQIPLVRPICQGQISEQLAIQASEELAMTIDTSQAREIDAVDLPPLPVEASRVLAAFRLDAAITATGPGAAVALKTAVHKNYEIPSALAISAELTTYLDVQGGQRTEARFHIANAGQQFLTVRLPDGAELWSLRVGDKQAKPQQNARGDYQVALGQLGRPTAVKIVYAYQPGEANLEQLKLGGVQLPGVEMNQMSWIVIPPPDYQITTQETRMHTSDLIRPVPAYVRFRNFLVRNAFVGPLRVFSRDYGGIAKRAELALAMSQERARMGRGGYGGGAYGRAADAPAPASQRVPAKPKMTEPVTGKIRRVRLAGQGRFTLPVDLIPTPSAGPRARFTGLGTAELVIGLTSRSHQTSWWTLGFMLIAAAGVVLVRHAVKVRVVFIIAVLSVASLLAVWRPAATNFANGAFTAGLCLVLLYGLVWFVRWLWGRLFSPCAASPASGTIVFLLMLCLACSVQTAGAVEAQPGQGRQEDSILQNEPRSQPRRETEAAMPPVIIPYEGEPTAAEKSDKILIPYTRFVELWNQAHPEDTIDRPRPGTHISLSDVQYSVTVEQEQLNLLLTAGISTYGKDWAVLGLPISGLAVTKATLDGKAAQLQAGPKGMVLMVPGETSGRLELQAVMKPKYMGRRGSASFSLPPLPGAVMKVVLPEEDLELEVDQIESAPARRTANGSVEYSFGLGMTRKLALRWLPKVGVGATDRTLSANSEHDVYAFHWAIVGVSRITYSFSSGDHSRFALLVPKYAMLAELKGTNVRDFRDVGEKTIEGKVFKLIEVRLHRAAQKQYELTVRWLSPHPCGGAGLPGGDVVTPTTGIGTNIEKPTELSLVRAGDVSRESGTVTLHSAGGMSVKVAQVSGGRRADITVDKEPQGAELTADRAKAVAKYYWPYRPFTLLVQLSRLAVAPKVHLNQLVRINTDRVEVLVQANLKAEQGKLFGASFILPQAYELLSAVGPAVENFYESSSEKGKFLHIKFHRGQRETKVAIVLVRRDVQLESLEVPTIMYLDHEGHPLAEQKGRLAVQVAASLEAETAASENLKSISPQTLKDWLDARQINSAQFAYRYEVANPSLQLIIRRLPTAIRVEAFAGLVVRATAAVYTYRLRYNIAGSPVDHLSFRLPSEYAPLITVESQALRSVVKSDAGNGQTRWTVVLVNEATGIVDVVVNFALPIDSSTKALQIPPPQTEAPAGYRAIVAVQNVSRHEISVADSANLSELAVSEQQKLMPREMRESLQYVFQSFEDSWLLSLELKPAKMAIRIQAVVDLVELTTVVDRSGRCRYEAKVALQNRSEQFLRVRMPKGLRLWSANVAGQPVKPVTAVDSPEGEVSIPLVKTSPGGLPYDVYLYFADEGTKPLVVPLNGITKLNPPSISIVGIPVMQTAWSLLLPGGYRYMRPGGNMSPVAGTVEVLSLGIEAKLEQLKRLEKTYRDVAGASFQREQIAKRNWEVFNKKLAAEIGQAESYLNARRNMVSEEDYQRLRTKLGGQRQLQDVIVGSNVSFVQRQEEQARNDLNFFLNVNASNAGVAEIVRNEVLLEKPGFLSKSEEQQITRLEQELEVSQQQLKLLEQKTEGLIETDEARKKGLSSAGGKQAGELIVDFTDKDAEMGKMLGQLARETTTQIDEKQAQLKGQLEELRDSRLQRHFQAGSDTVRALRSQAERQAQPQEERVTAGDRYAAGYEYGGLGGRARSQTQLARGQTRAGFPQLRVGEGPEVGEPAAPSAEQPYMPEAAPGDVQLYTAKGVYSLPVTLPKGEVRLDFARPSGEAELSLWAVPLSTIRNLYGTLTVFVGLFVIVGLVKIWPRPEQKRPISARRVISYTLLFVALVLVLGLLGLLISLFIILLSEARRGVFARPAVAKVEN